MTNAHKVNAVTHTAVKDLIRLTMQSTYPVNLKSQLASIDIIVTGVSGRYETK
jgi:hypothetical protein